MRLNKAVRMEIMRNASKVLDDRLKALCQREYVLSNECYYVAVLPSVRSAIKDIENAAPQARSGERGSPWLDYSHHVAFNVAGQHIKLTCSPALAVPNRYSQYNTLGKPITMDKHRKLVEMVQTWTNDWAQYIKDKAAADNTLNALLKSVGSTETLFKVWPEGKKFYSSPPLTPIVKTGVPAVQMEALNKMIGLTPELPQR